MCATATGLLGQCSNGRCSSLATCPDPPGSSGGSGGSGAPTPINGGWTAWSGYSPCDVTCGNGKRTRTRTCTNPAPSGGGDDCTGSSSSTALCIQPACVVKVDGGWSAWSAYGSCSNTCGSGSVRIATRVCDDPPPSNGGAVCEGESSRTSFCSVPGCPVDGQWGEWGDWSECSLTCGRGVQVATRACDSPSPANGGRSCGQEHGSRRKDCVRPACPPGKIAGGWSAWGSWSDCSKTCGVGGRRSRARTCDNPEPQHGGAECEGSRVTTDVCGSDMVCPVDGAWSAWGSWSPCSRTCGNGGSRARERRCDNPLPAGGGKNCHGLDSESSACPTQVECVVPGPGDSSDEGEGAWSEWSAWSACGAACGPGAVRVRTRECLAATAPVGSAPPTCDGDAAEKRTCGPSVCPSASDVSGGVDGQSAGLSSDAATAAGTSDKPAWPIALGATLGALLLVAALVGAAVFLRRRRQEQALSAVAARGAPAPTKVREGSGSQRPFS